MMSVSIRQLMLERASGAVSLGIASRDVLAALGEPTDRSLTKPPILKYGPLELTFIKDRLVLMAYHAGQAPDARIEEDVPTSRDEVESLLDAEGVAVAVDPVLSYDNQLALSLRGDPSNVVLFERDRLRSIQLAGDEST